ncbi:MAG: hypothetical protein Q9160_004829 [Pyrenula sp. 1 TL-2023]
MLYDAKILEVRQSSEKEGKPTYEYRVHYKGWKNTWDDWVPSDRLRPINDENRLLQHQLKVDITGSGSDPRRSQNSKPPVSSKKGRGQGSEMGSGRGSEDPNANPGSRRRAKDNDIEKVGDYLYSSPKDPELPGSGPDPNASNSHYMDLPTTPRSTSQQLDASSVSSRTISRISSTPGPPTPKHELSSSPIPTRTLDEIHTAEDFDVHNLASDLIKAIRPSRNRNRNATPLSKLSRNERYANRNRNNSPLSKHDRHTDRVVKPRSARCRSDNVAATPGRPLNEMSFEDIDAEFSHAPPADSVEHMSREEQKRSHPCAPLISGTIGSGPQGSIEHHPSLHRAICERTPFASKIIFYKACDPKYPKVYIAGVPQTPNTPNQEAFDPPGSNSQFDINLHSHSFRELRLPVIIYHIAKAKTIQALRKFIRTLEEQLPIKKPPKWKIVPPTQASDKSFRDYQDSLHADPQLINYLEFLTAEGAPADLPKTPGMANAESRLFAQKAITTTNATLIIQMCQVLTDLPGSQEDQYRLKPMVRIPVPEHLKYLLVDDWENITKNLQLVDLPSKRPVNFILDEYFTQKRNERPLGSPDAAILEEFHSGMKVYFQKALGKLLLYRFERDQYADLQKYWTSTGVRCVDVDGNSVQYKGTMPGDIYGGEHLLRLIVSFPELIAQTNMDNPSVNRLREEIMRFTTWLSQHANEFFVNRYVGATQEYIERATASGT